MLAVCIFSGGVHAKFFFFFFSWQVKGSLLSVNESFVRTMSYHSLFCHCGRCSTLTMASSSEQTFFLLMDSNLRMFSYGLHVHLTVSHPHDCWDTVPCCCLKTWLLSSSCFRFTHPCGFLVYIYLFSLYAHTCVQMHTRVCTCGGQLSPSTMWVPGDPTQAWAQEALPTKPSFWP